MLVRAGVAAGRADVGKQFGFRRLSTSVFESVFETKGSIQGIPTEIKGFDHESIFSMVVNCDGIIHPVFDGQTGHLTSAPTVN